MTKSNGISEQFLLLLAEFRNSLVNHLSDITRQENHQFNHEIPSTGTSDTRGV